MLYSGSFTKIHAALLHTAGRLVLGLRWDSFNTGSFLGNKFWLVWGADLDCVQVTSDAAGFAASLEFLVRKAAGA